MRKTGAFINRTIKIVICSCSIWLFSNAQDSLVLDFKSKIFDAKGIRNNLNEGDLYVFKIKNINTYLYDVNIETRDTVFSHKLPFPSISGLGTFNLDSITSLIRNLSPLAVEKIEEKVYEGFIQENEMTSQQKKGRVKALINTEQNTLRRYATDLDTIKTRIDILAVRIKEKALSVLIEDTCSNFFSLLQAHNYSAFGLVEEMEHLRSDMAGRQKRIIERHAWYSSKAEQYKDAISADPELKKGDAQIQAAYSQLEKTITEVLASMNAEKCEGAIRSLLAAENTKYEYTSLPFQLKGESKILRLSITPRDSVNRTFRYSEEYRFPYGQRSFISVGSAFYVSTLFDDAYSTAAMLSTDTTYKIMQEQRGMVEIGLQAMMMIGFCSSDKGYFYGSFGPAISIAKSVKPRLLIGGGYAFGKRNMLTVGVNIVIGSVDRKSDVYAVDTLYRQKPEQITVSRTEFGIGLTIGYVFNL